jgi:hypothetical protein
MLAWDLEVDDLLSGFTQPRWSGRLQIMRRRQAIGGKQFTLLSHRNRRFMSQENCLSRFIKLQACSISHTHTWFCLKMALFTRSQKTTTERCCSRLIARLQKCIAGIISIYLREGLEKAEPLLLHCSINKRTSRASYMAERGR